MWARKKTIGELLAQVQQANRGGSVKSQKMSTDLPESKFDFSSVSPRNVNLDSVKPPKGMDLFKPDTEDQAEYERILDRQMEELFKLTKKYRDSRERGEYWLRLAELYVEKAAMINTHEQDDYDRKLKDFKEGKRKQRPTYEMGQSREFYRKAIQLYEWFQRDFPKDPKMDQALFFLGFNYFELGDPDKGAEFYSRLTHQFPTSPFVGESNFALAEYHFEKDQWNEAYKYYLPIIKDRRHRLNILSRYKGAWCLYRMTRYRDALTGLETIIRMTHNEANLSKDERRNFNSGRLEQEAKRDLVLFFAAVGDPDNAINYFNEMLGEDGLPQVARLAYYYSDRGEKESARTIFAALIEKNPRGPKAFEYQYQIVQNYYYVKNTDKFREELYRLVRNYGPESSWYSANSGNKQLLNNSQKLREMALRTFILQTHQTAQNSRASYSQTMANEAYQLYFQEFTTSERIPDMHFFYGELLFDMGRFDEAGAQYKWVVENAPENKYVNKAAANIMHSFEKSLPSDQELARKTGDSIEKIPIESKVEHFIKAGYNFLEKYPSSPKALETEFRIGRIYYQHNHFEEATDIFRKIVKKSPKSKFGEYSANLLLDIYSLKKDYIGLEKTGNELLAVPEIADSKAGSDIKGVIEKANFKKAEDLERDKKYLESAIQYEVFAKQNSVSELAYRARFNAGVNFERGGNNSKAIAMYYAIIQARDKNAEPYKGKSRKLLAKLYQDSGQLEEAARLFRLIADENPKDPLAVNYIYNVAVLSAILDRDDVAIKNYEEFIKTSKKYNEKLEATFAMAELERERNRNSSAMEKYKAYIEGGGSNPENVIQSYYRITELLRKRGAMNDADDWQKKTLYIQRKLARNNRALGAEYAAKLKLREAREIFVEFKTIRFPANQKKQEIAFKKKTELLKKLTAQLNEVIKIDSADEIISSLAILGFANQDMADTISSAPLPGDLNANEQKTYKDEIHKKLVEPALQNAFESYKRAISKASDLETYNDDYRLARQRINKLDGSRYYDNGELGMDSRLVNWMGPQ